jgi:hypothetical protein
MANDRAIDREAFRGLGTNIIHVVKLLDRIFARQFLNPDNMILTSPLRKGENFHIVLWLVKDMCWVMDQKMIGTIMIAPTVLMAIWIAWKSREEIGELLHSLAVVFWIMANGTWMIGEFYFEDGTRGLAIPLFLLGLACVAIHYLILLPVRALRDGRVRRDSMK